MDYNNCNLPLWTTDSGPTENPGRQLTFQFSIPEIHGGFHCCFSFLHTHPAMHWYCTVFVVVVLSFLDLQWTCFYIHKLNISGKKYNVTCKSWDDESFFIVCKNGVHARKLNNMAWIHLKPRALNQLWARFTLQCENWTWRMTCRSLSSSFCFWHFGIFHTFYVKQPCTIHNACFF